jgi:hypothetical protein
MTPLRFLALLTLASLATACATARPEATTLTPETRSLVDRTAAEITVGATSEREKAVRIYDWVRDEVEYGFTRRFDEADPAFTLEVGRGHCNPQTELVVALMRAAGLEARQRFVTIDADILDGLFPKRAKPPEELNHSYAEVRLDGRWVRIDGYAVDRELWLGGRARLAEEGQAAGYGVHRDSCSEWDGGSDCMGQFVDPAWQRVLYEPIDPARSFYAGDGYTQRLSGLEGFLYRRFGVDWMNRKLQALREEGQELEERSGVPPELVASDRDAVDAASDGG